MYKLVLVINMVIAGPATSSPATRIVTQAIEHIGDYPSRDACQAAAQDAFRFEPKMPHAEYGWTFICVRRPEAK